ncbi:hypothetical protein R5W24_001658 [Gemmata sp. JC717]|uniref:hypothetical protein n=1 Tax=Gemmata algarum TaxID=2975278 RepID=UPI0021BAE130|nr:hypothetical protein [Gemmata algarum]MDY3552574.1 hypothetical protein [Gemmata algarum]
MATLEQLLRAALRGAGEQFNEASKALHVAVVELAKAVEAATEGKATVRLRPKSRLQGRTGKMESPENAIYYSLVVLAKGDDEGRELTTFCVSYNGFPISYEIDHQWHKFWSPEEFATDYLTKLASDPDSPLVGYLAFIVRNSAAPSPSMVNEPAVF